MEQYELPGGWVWVTLGEICTPPQYGYTTKATGDKHGPQFLRITDLNKGGVNWDTVPYCDTPPADPEKFRLKDGDLVVARSGSVGKAYHVVEPPDAVFASYLIRFRTIEASSEYLGYFLQSPIYWEQIEDSSTGTAMFNVNAQKIAALELPLAPLPEQLRIAEKIEALFEQSRTAREALDAIPALLRQFRQAVLAAAFRGELSTRDPDDEPASALLERILDERRRRWEEDLRAKGKDPRRYTYPEPASPDTSNLPALPEGWCWATVEQLGAIDEQAVLTGPFGSNLGRDDFVDTGVPVLTIGCLTEQGIVLDKAFYVSEEKAVELARYRVQQSDILFSRMASVGRADMVSADIEGSIINYHLMRLRLHRSAIDPKFFVFYVRGSTNVTDYLHEINHGITRDGINTQQLLRLPVALAPKAEQREIVSRVQSLFTQADIVEVAAEIARRRLDRLDQSILARAFRGELVPQDPNDEPAWVLLERIRAERARRAGERAARRRK